MPITQNAYSASVITPEFRGLAQTRDGYGTDARYAMDCENVETRGGALRPAAACEALPALSDAPIETLSVLHRRWYAGANTRDVLIAAAGGQLYHMLPDATAWARIELPIGWNGERYQSNSWSWVAYEIKSGSAEDAPIDVLLMSNGKDGMIMIRGDTMLAERVSTPKRFGVIERYAERVWGGAIDDEPDMLAYSAPYDPADWTANAETPEDGAGDVTQPSWDGDRFTALRAFGSQLIAFKKTRVWRVLGTNPGEYVFSEQFGGGAAYADTIAVCGERIFMLGELGVMVYDGLAVEAFQQETVRGVLRRVNAGALPRAAACVWHGKYYCALPLDSGVRNNAVLIYDTLEGNWLMRTDYAVDAFLPTEDALYFTGGTADGAEGQTPNRVWRWRDDSWEAGAATGAAVRWVSPWNRLSDARLMLSGFEIYLTPEVQSAPVDLRITIETENRLKAKTLTVTPNQTGRFPLRHIHIAGAGRRFRYAIETAPGAGVWRLVGGLSVIADVDSD